MQNVKVAKTVREATEILRKSVEEKGFVVFSDIDHQANASKADMEMPAARVLIFGNPVAGTNLMKKDITVSFDLPIRIAIVDDNGQTIIMYNATEDYTKAYNVEGHPVLEKMESLFHTLVSELE